METLRDAEALNVVLLLLHSCVSHSDELHSSDQLEKSSQTISCLFCSLLFNVFFSSSMKDVNLIK